MRRLFPLSSKKSRGRRRGVPGYVQLFCGELMLQLPMHAKHILTMLPLGTFDHALSGTQ